MKELSIKEKAKRYDKALGNAEYYHSEMGDDVKCVLEEVFSELRESEDESEDDEIRRALLNTVKYYYPNESPYMLGISQEQVIAWLEKQGNQKPADKVEPRFKVGDWITNCKLLVGQVTSFDGEYYHYMCNGIEQPLHVSNAHKWHLWTIQDAKEGDVLVDRYGNIGIFEKTFGLDWHSYCYLGCNGDFMYNEVGGSHDLVDTYPVNKEQRDLLFQKMKEAGYEWDSGTKELKKIHVIDEGKAEMDYCFTKMMNGEKVSPAWSEEDLKTLDKLICILDGIRYYNTRTNVQEVPYKPEIDWLNSLKTRVLK